MEIANTLWKLSGQTVSVRQDGAFGKTLIDFEETLPLDLAPLVILDASGRIRETYSEMELKRENIVRLKTATKRYSSLNVHLWRRGAGKTGWSSNRPIFLEGIAKTIQSKPSEKWLIVVHKVNNQVGDIEKDVRKMLGSLQDNVSFITWGNHSSTNEFSNIQNVILAGTLFFRGSQYEALKRLSAGKRADDMTVTQEEVDQFALGEHCHQILQALCRGSVRKCKGDICLPMDAYVIASSRSGIEKVIPTVFPECRIVHWRPVKNTLSGKVKEAYDYLKNWFESTKEYSIKFSTVYQAIHMLSPDFTKSVRSHPHFIEAIHELGLMQDEVGERKTKFIRSAEYYFGDEE